MSAHAAAGHVDAPSPEVHGPSRPSKRLAVALLALAGALVSARLAAYQLGWTGPPWEPLFGDGAVRVLDSSFSRAIEKLGVPDAALGMLAYLAEVAAVAWGDRERYRTKRLAVLLYGAIAFAMALGSVGLVVVQIAVVHALCTLCLVSAILSFVLAAPAWTEVRAAWRSRRRGG